MTNEEIKKILIDANYTTAEDIDKVESTMNRADSLSDALIREGTITSTILGQAIAEFYGVVYADLNSHPPFRESVLKIPEDTARKYRVIVFNEDEDKVTIATDNPKQEDLIKILPEIFKEKKIYLVYSNPEQIDEQFSVYQKSFDLFLFQKFCDFIYKITFSKRTKIKK